MEWKNLPLSPEARECLIAEMEAKFQALSPHRQWAFLWALEHMDLMEALAEKTNGKPPPTDPSGRGGRRVIGWRPGGFSGEEGIFSLYQNHPTSFGQRLEGGQVPLQNAGGCDVDLFLVCDVQEGGVV